MKLKISKYEYVKTLKEDIELEMPDKPIFFFEFGYRVSWAVIPEWTTWQVERKGEPEEIWRYRIIVVDGECVKTFDLQTYSIENNYVQMTKEGRSDYHARLLRHMELGIEPRMIRTKEQFENDMNTVIDKCNNYLNSIE